MSSVRKSKNSTQSNSSASRLSKLLELNSKVLRFSEHASNAELEIRENYGKGRIPPCMCYGEWDHNFAQSYEEIKVDLTQFCMPKLTFGPPGTAYMSGPVKTDNAVQAWMYYLNPPCMAYGEPGYLESNEYQEIKIKALSLLHFIVTPRWDHILTPTQIDILNVLTEIPQTTDQIAINADCSPEAARKYLPMLRKLGIVFKAEKNGYFRLP